LEQAALLLAALHPPERLSSAAMDWLSTDPNRPGVFAVGGEAVGIFALGQAALGVIAVGQVARGVIAVGQGAVGIVAIGQGALGVLYGLGMVATGAFGGGLVLRMVPKRQVAADTPPPQATPIELLLEAGEGTGWVPVEIVRDGDGVTVTHERVQLGIASGDVARLAQDLARALGSKRRRPAFVRVEAHRVTSGAAPGYRAAAPHETELRVLAVHDWRPAEFSPLADRGIGVVGLLARLLGMFVLVVAWWLLAGRSIVAMFA